MSIKTSSIIVPNLKQELLDTFLKNNIQYFSKNIELIIVTSALTGKNILEYRKNYPTVRFIPITKNFGFAHTVNIGFRVATGEFVGTCNDDVVLQKNWVEKLLQHATITTGSINPIITDIDGTIETAGITIHPKGKAYPITQMPHQAVTQTDATNAACVLYNKQALNKVGMFDERFGSYLEDIDLSLRLKRAGYDNIVVNTVRITHLKHQTANSINFNKAYHDFKNWILVIIKNWSYRDLLLNSPAILLERARNFWGIIKQVLS